MPVTRTFSLDTVQQNIFPIIIVKANDYNSRYFDIKILENGLPYIIPSTASVVLNFRRYDGATNSFPAALSDADRITFLVPDWVLMVCGLCHVCVTITDNNTVLSTLNFQIFAEANPYNNQKIVYYNYKGFLAAGTYYIIDNATPYSFTTTIGVPLGGAITYSNGYITTWQTAELQDVIETDIPVIQQIAGDLLTAETLIRKLCRDADATEGDLLQGKTAYSSSGKITGASSSTAYWVIFE